MEGGEENVRDPGLGDSNSTGTGSIDTGREIEATQDRAVKQDDNGDTFMDCSSILQSFGYVDDKKVINVSDDTYARKLAEDANIARITGSFCDVTLLIGMALYFGQNYFPVLNH